MASYAVSGDSVTLTYAYNDALLNADIESWHLVDDNTKTVAGITLNSNIKKGAIILQTSKDGINWLTDVKQTNVFADTPVQTESFYSANSIQLANGCYYRLIVAYKTAKKVGENQILFVTTDIINYLKTAEVYEFYLHSTQQAHNENVKTKTLGSVVNTGKDNGYSGSSALTISDPHYGWQIGEFFVSGYTRDTKDDDGTPVFLKNVGDQITLWFNLKQDIDCLNGSDILSISEDVNGYDQYFQTAKTNMGRGTLIIRYTDEKGIKHEPEIYTNYLAANATTSADTVVKLYCDDHWSSEQTAAWDAKREAFIKIIEDKKREADLKDPNNLFMPAPSSSFKGKKYTDVVDQLKSLGFTNVTTQVASESPGLFDKNDTVEHILVGGKTEFTAEDYFNKDTPIIVYYYSK